jgi:nucleotide-binding universal stress UspA family protein
LGEAVFAESRSHLPAEYRAKVQTILGTQKPIRGVIAAVSDWRADVVCVGSRGLGPIQSMLLGSVASAVVQTVQIPVLVAREFSSAEPQGLRVLLAYDRTNAATQAAALNNFAWPAGSKAQLVDVIDALPAPLPAWMEKRARSADAEAMAEAWVHEHQEEKQECVERLQAFRKSLPQIFQSCTPVVAEGHPAEQILRVAAESNTDLIVVGKSSRTLYQRVMLGSTSRAVLQQAGCSVLVVPLREAP